MTKKEIVRQVSEKANLTQQRTKEIVQLTLDAIIEALEQDGRVELRNFGVFEVRIRKARMARNPRTHEEVPITEKKVVAFTPGKAMEERIRDADLTVLRGQPTYITRDDSNEDDDADMAAVLEMTPGRSREVAGPGLDLTPAPTRMTYPEVPDGDPQRSSRTLDASEPGSNEDDSLPPALKPR